MAMEGMRLKVWGPVENALWFQRRRYFRGIFFTTCPYSLGSFAARLGADRFDDAAGYNVESRYEYVRAEDSLILECGEPSFAGKALVDLPLKCLPGLHLCPFGSLEIIEYYYRGKVYYDGQG